jgi:Protein of unknown function (DUF1496)
LLRYMRPSGMIDMNARHFRLFSLACCAALIAATPLRAELPASGPSCVYANRAYSDGAFICVQKSLMLSCIADGTRARWNMVADRDLSERCVAPTALSAAPGPRRHGHRPHASRPRIAPVAAASAKCFHFNGKQYCE